MNFIEIERRLAVADQSHNDLLKARTYLEGAAEEFSGTEYEIDFRTALRSTLLSIEGSEAYIKSLRKLRGLE